MHSTAQAAQRIGVCKNTLLRWIREGLISDVGRDWRFWRVWSKQDIAAAIAFKRSYHGRPLSRARRRPLPRARYAKFSSESMCLYAKGLRSGGRGSP